jgi:hypothetical protein
MQRRRFEMERSAPPMEHDDEASSSQRPSVPPLDAHHNSALVPSAPMLDDDDEGLVDAVRQGRGAASGGLQGEEERSSEALPEYQR